MARAGAIVLALVLALHGDARAGGFGIPEIGVRRTAMASIIGRPDDASAIYHNPAGLVLQHGWQLYASFGLSLLDCEFQLAPWSDSDQYLGQTARADGYYAPVKPSRAFGVVPMLAATAELLPSKLVVGAAVYVSNGTGAKFGRGEVTRYHLTDAYIITPQAVVSAAYRVHPTLSLGASLGAINVRLHEEREIYPVLGGMDISGLVRAHSLLAVDGSAWAPTWTVAAFGQPHPRVTWGATIIGKVDAKLKGPIDVTFGPDHPNNGLVAFEGTARMHQLLPWTFMAGANVDVAPNVEIGGELRYWLYRQYKEQVITIRDIPVIDELRSQKDYHDSWELSGGVRVHDLEAAPALELMAGVQYDATPAPSRTVTLDQPSFSHWGAHGGARYRLGRYRLGASYVHYWYDIPTTTDSITDPPSNVRGAGGNHIMTASLEVAL